jgi:hypothetical protein
MSDITRASDINFDADGLMRCSLIKGDDIKAGEALEKGDICFIDSDGLVYEAVTTTSGWHGMAYVDYALGAPVTLAGEGAIVSYGDSMTPGAKLYLSSNKGELATTGTTIVADVLEDDRIILTKV